MKTCSSTSTTSRAGNPCAPGSGCGTRPRRARRGRGPCAWCRGARGLSPAAGGTTGLVGALAALTLGLRWLGWPWAWAWIAAINPVAFVVYAWDKRQGRRHRRRVPEWVLLALAFVGGWPAAALAMALLRHKTRKASFRIAFGVVVVVQILLLAAWAWKR